MFNTKPEIRGFTKFNNYYQALLATSRLGDMLFGNNSRYIECGRLIDENEAYLDSYTALPKSYKKRIDEINDW